MTMKMFLSKKSLKTCVLGLLAGFSFSFATGTVKKPENVLQFLQNAGAKIIQKKNLGDISQIVVKFPDGRKEVGYISNDNRYLIVGTVIDTKTGENLTALEYQKLDRINVSKLPLNEAIKLKFGKANKKLIMIADPDCPFCREAYNYLKGKNVEIYLFLFPLNIHPHAYEHAVKILCSKDPAKAYEELEAGKPLHVSFCKAGKEKLKKYIELGNELNVNGTPTFFTMKGYRILGANIPELEEVLK